MKTYKLLFIGPPILLIRCSIFMCAVILCCCSMRVAAQSITPGFGIEMNVYGGKIFRHTPKFTSPIPVFSASGEINFIWKSCGKKDWQRRRNCPQTGIGISYTDYGDNKILGRNIGIYPNIEFPLISKPHFEWTFRIGMGLGYVSRHYSRTSPYWDTLNVVIGSHINNFTLFATDVRWHVNKHWDVQAGISLSHISDAAYRKPNLGINMVSGHIGLRYFPATSRPVKSNEPVAKLKNRWLLQSRVGIAMNSQSSGNGPLYPVYLASLYVSKRFAGKNKLFAGVDYSFHESVYAFLRNNEIFPGQERQHSWKSSVFTGFEFLYGKAGLLLQAGVYTQNTYLNVGFFYQKLGINWYLLQKEQGFFKEIYISTLIKTHFTQAELAEFGAGFGF